MYMKNNIPWSKNLLTQIEVVFRVEEGLYS